MLRQPRPLVPFTFPFTGQSYEQRILNTRKASLIALWDLGDTSGTTAVNAEGTAARSGTYTNGVTLNAATFTDGTPAPGFDGMDDFVSIYSDSLRDAFNTNELTLMIWAKVSALSDWSDGQNHTFMDVGANGLNFVRFLKTGGGSIIGTYIAGGTSKSVSWTVSPTSWFHLALTVSKAADELKVYYDGSPQGTTQTGLGTWSGALSSNVTNIASNNGSGSLTWKGFLKYAALWSAPLSASEVAVLATV